MFITGATSNELVIPEPIQIHAITSHPPTPPFSIDRINGTIPTSDIHIPNLVQVVQFSPAVEHIPEVICLHLFRI